MQKRLLLLGLVLFASLAFSGSLLAQAAAPSIKTIDGNPLKINVASDGSFQVFNADVPGFGQIYPTSAQDADMGIFAWIDNKLYSPNFTAHGGTATGNLGNYTPWTNVSISDVQGDGTAESPFTVVVVLKAPDNDVQIRETVTYVNGINFFRILKNVTQSGGHTVDVILGADIYLSGSDQGVFLAVPELNAVGGQDCETPATYHILLIAITAAADFGTDTYSDVWSQIAANDLELAEPGACVDNGAAIKWQNVLNGVSDVTIESAVSFGEIPSANAFISFTASIDPSSIVAYPGDSVAFVLNTHHNEESGFNSPLELTVGDLPPGFHVTLDSTTIPAPGDGTVTGLLTVDSNVAFGAYPGLRINVSGGGQSLSAVFNVEVICDPPMILGINMPKSQTVTKGQTVTLRAQSEHTGPFSYQWFNGYAGYSSTAIPGATSSTFTTPPINATDAYWVRVSNACGSYDSQTAIITPR